MGLFRVNANIYDRGANKIAKSNRAAAQAAAAQAAHANRIAQADLNFRIWEAQNAQYLAAQQAQQQIQGPAPAGWYPDPGMPGREMLWDGQQWIKTSTRPAQWR